MNESALQTSNFLLNIFHVEACADHPAPRREAGDIGLLRLQAAWVIRPLPDIVHIPLLMAADDLGEFDKDADSARVFEFGEIFSVQIRAIGMHDHARVHILQPEIILVFMAVTKCRDLPEGLLLSLVACHASGLNLVLGMRHDRACRMGKLSDHLTFPVEQATFERRQQQAPDCDHKEDNR